MIPEKYKWIETIGALPKHMQTAMDLMGIKEIPGTANNTVIMGMAEEIGLDEYTNDDIAWCGLFVGYCWHKAGRLVVDKPLWARNWNKAGVKVTPRDAAFADILVFQRAGGFGHVGFYVGEDATAYHVAGGNQSNSTSIIRIEKTRLIGVRRAPYINMPATVKKYHLQASGPLSQNEA
jgi:uncharacterized protein (TIGR02594 family)